MVGENERMEELRVQREAMLFRMQQKTIQNLGRIVDVFGLSRVNNQLNEAREFISSHFLAGKTFSRYSVEAAYNSEGDLDSLELKTYHFGDDPNGHRTVEFGPRRFAIYRNEGENKHE